MRAATSDSASVRRPVPALLTLANSRRPRKPRPGRRDASLPDPFTAPEDARRLLAPLGVAAPQTNDEVAELGELAEEVSAIADALAHGTRVPAPTVLNRLAAQANGHPRLEIRDGRLVAATDWELPTPACDLARRIIQELDGLDPARLRQCARPRCSLLFYDATRSNTRRWHAEDPCGRDERQARHRSKTSRRAP